MRHFSPSEFAGKTKLIREKNRDPASTPNPSGPFEVVQVGEGLLSGEGIVCAIIDIQVGERVIVWIGDEQKKPAAMGNDVSRRRRSHKPGDGSDTSQPHPRRTRLRRSGGLADFCRRCCRGGNDDPEGVSREQRSVIDRLVLETLAKIRYLMGNDQDPPSCMVRLHLFAERDVGWLAVVHSMIQVVPIHDPFGPVCISQLLKDCPLPTSETFRTLTDNLNLSAELSRQSVSNPSWHRNVAIVLGCIAEKMAGPRSIVLFTRGTMEYLLANLDPSVHPIVILFSLVALEKFAQMTENKLALIKRLNQGTATLDANVCADSDAGTNICSKADTDTDAPNGASPLGRRDTNICPDLDAEICADSDAHICADSDVHICANFNASDMIVKAGTSQGSKLSANMGAGTCADSGADADVCADLNVNPLLRLEKLWHDAEDDCLKRQIGFCARWCLDNLFLVDGRPFSYTLQDMSNIHAMLNANDVSECLKIGVNGLEARCDVSSFESVRCTFEVSEGVWYYEVKIITAGIMQIGWATKESKFLNHDGYGIGDDNTSLAFDGCRQLTWHDAQSTSHEHLLPRRWCPGDIIGCLLDFDLEQVIFSLNGDRLPPLGAVTKKMLASTSSGFFAAASFMSFQQCVFNFGAEPFVHPPDSFRAFNCHAQMKEEDKVILPRHVQLAQLQRHSMNEDACTVCFDRPAKVRLRPCAHQGYCEQCSQQLDSCPMCRSNIDFIEHDQEQDSVAGEA